MEIEINNLMAPTFVPVMYDILDGNHREYWLKGGRSSTKSSFISLMIALGLLMDKDANAIIYRRVGNTIKDSVYAQMIWAIDVLGQAGNFVYRRSPYEIINRKTGQRIMFRGADDPVKSKSIKLTQGYFKYLWFEELSDFRGLEDIRMIKQSVFRGVSKGYTFYSYNPPRTMANWVNKEALLTKPERLVHHSTYLDVPQDWLKDEFIAEAESVKATNERAYRNEYLGEATGTGGNVFDNLELRELTQAEQDIATLYCGLDFGFAIDPDAFIKVGYDQRIKKVIVLDEFYGSKNSTDRLCEEVAKRAGRMVVRCDCADSRMIAELTNRGIQAIGVKKGAGSVEHGIRWLQDCAGIVIDPKRTPNAAREFASYEYLPDNNGGFISAFPDKDNHCLTGDTIVNTVDGDKRIDELIGQTGKVYCYDEQTRQATTACFFDVRQTGIEEIFEIELEDGRTIKCSGEHPILTRDGWKLARNLADSDEILEVQVW